jgi:hypothetical protein
VKTKATPLDEIVRVKSSVELYRLVSREDLHLRRGLGRDDALLRQLAKKLDLDPNRPIPKQLETRKISLEDFVQAFFSLTEPFAAMMSDIYSNMERQGVRSAKRSIRMRFSFQKAAEELEFDLEHFREWLAIYRRVRGTFVLRLWSQDDINKLLRPVQTLQKTCGSSYNWGQISYSSPLPEPLILYIDSRWTPLRQLRDAMEELRGIASEETDEHSKVLSVLTKEYERKEQQTIECDPSRIRTMLSDLWPGLVGLLSQLRQSVPKSLNQEAISALQKIQQVLEDIQRTRIESEALVRDLMEFLRLPFWKHRWRVYEVWVMFEIIDCLDEYNIALELTRDRLNLEEHKATKVAQFEDLDRNRYEVWTQLITPVGTPYKKKHIMPDIRLCRRNASIPENTFLLIECKQRKSMRPQDLEDLVEDYKRGANKSVLNLFVNYDEFPAISHPIPHMGLLSNVNPAHPSIVLEFKNLVKHALIDDGIEPTVPEFDAIVFDVSGSMQGRYTDSEINEACRYLLIKNTRSKTFFFSNSLLPSEQLSSPALVSELDRMTNGKTNLDGALRELHTKHPDMESVAIVTDGEYDVPVRSFELFKNVEELILGKNFPSKPNQPEETNSAC